jgi:hypothetical protein
LPDNLVLVSGDTRGYRDRNPGADVRTGVAEALPWPAGHFDATLSCLAFGFMRDPHLRWEMARPGAPGTAWG